MDYYKYMVERLGKVIAENRCGFILYPFGKHGAMAKGILNGLYGVQEKAIIDNKLCAEYGHIKSVDYLDNAVLDGCKVLIVSDGIYCYNELRESLYAKVDKAQCVELLPEPEMIREVRENSPKIIKKMADGNVSLEHPVYHPKKTQSDFYLPLIMTDCIQSQILLTDDYFERETLDNVFTGYKNGIIGKRVKGNVVIDIGANIGNHTLYFCNECGAGKVHCFEPVEATFSTLQENVALNRLEQKTRLYRFGLGIKEERVSADGYHIHNTGATRLKPDESGKLLVKRLDDLEIEGDVAFVKIDAEEMEANVLEGGIETIRKNKPYIMVESFGSNIYKVGELLQDLGYTYECIDWAANYLFSPA